MDATLSLPDDLAGGFMPPAVSDLVSSLVADYKAMRAKVERMASVVNGEEYAGALAHFASGNKIEGRHVSVDRMFDLPGALASLNSASWARAMNMTDIYNAMPQKRRDEWNKAISEMVTPDFEENTVRETMQALMSSRPQFFAERVDGIFRALSHTHVTNSPMGFRKRMILSRVVTEYGYPEHSRCGVINDLRAVIARFMGRDEPGHNATYSIVQHARKTPGDWIALDGGALRIRVYMVGTAHIEVHPDMAWRLNSVLAMMHPAAIPSEFRQAPKRAAKSFTLIQRPLPFAVLAMLGGLEQAYELRDRNNRHCGADKIPNALRFHYAAKEQGPVFDEACRVLATIGGVPDRLGVWRFSYPPEDVVGEIICSGCIPDRKSHQFFPTPERLAKIAAGMAEIGPAHECLEPSAGRGDLADQLPKDRTHCVEISELHAAILQAKGYPVDTADFIAWADATPRRFDRIVMNPPFSDGRAAAHAEAAARLLRPGGRLVAILPASMRGKFEPAGLANVAWSEIYAGEFTGTGVAVAIMAGDAR